MRPLTLTMNLNNASTTKVAAAQQIASAGNLTLAAAASAIDTSGAARILVFTTGEDDTAVNATITGKDANGNTITETLALPNHTTKVSTKAYASVSQIALSAGITANMSVGTVGTTLSAIGAWNPLEFYSRTGATVAVEVTGTINFTINETFDDLLGTGTSSAIAFAPTALASKTANTVASLDVGATGVQVQINSYSSGATLTARVISVLSDRG